MCGMYVCACACEWYHTTRFASSGYLEGVVQWVVASDVFLSKNRGGGREEGDEQ